MTLYSTLYGAANVCATYAWSMLPDSKARALESLIGDLGDNGVNKFHWQKHAKAILWPHSVLQLAVRQQPVSSTSLQIEITLCGAAVAYQKSVASTYIVSCTIVLLRFETSSWS